MNDEPTTQELDDVMADAIENGYVPPTAAAPSDDDDDLDDEPDDLPMNPPMNPPTNPPRPARVVPPAREPVAAKPAFNYAAIDSAGPLTNPAANRPDPPAPPPGPVTYFVDAPVLGSTDRKTRSAVRSSTASPSVASANRTRSRTCSAR